MTSHKICGACKEVRPAGCFAPHRKLRSGLNTYCRTCVNARAKQRRVGLRMSKQCLDCAIPLVTDKKKCEDCLERGLRPIRKVRLKAIQAYGGACVCCGEREPKFLTFDHIHNDGAKHRREQAAGGSAIQYWLRANNYPKDVVQLLCFNCNCGRATTRSKRCPHELRKQA